MEAYQAGADLLTRIRAPLELLSINGVPVDRLLELVRGEEAALRRHFQDLDQRLERIESALDQLVQQRSIKEIYTTTETAQLLGRASSRTVCNELASMATCLWAFR